MSGKIYINEADKTASIIKEVVEHVVPLDDFLKAIGNSFGVNIPVCPENTKGIVTGKNNSIFVVECAPSRRYMHYVWDPANKATRQFHLNIPWTYLFVCLQNNPVLIEKVGIAFSATRVMSSDAKIGYMALPNADYEDDLGIGYVCLGEVSIKIGKDAEKSLPLTVNEIISKIWSSPFNHDLIKPDLFGVHPITEFQKSNGYLEHCKEQLKESKGTPEEAYWKLVAGNQILNYLQAWHELSNEMVMADFLDKVELKKVIPYDKTLSNFMSEYMVD